MLASVTDRGSTHAGGHPGRGAIRALVGIVVLLLVLPAPAGVRTASAQWNPGAGDWGKSTPTDFRVMTWNVRDGIASDALKADGNNSWNALVRIVATVKPDVLILQEAGDTGSGVDSVSTLATVLGYFVNGGFDFFNGGAPVTSYLKLFDPALDYPYIFVSSNTDGFNRNAILSRHPFGDINNNPGDNLISDIIVFGSDAYAPGGGGGTRGYMMAEIDLPDEIYLSDAVVGNGHLKAFNSCSDQLQRETAAKNIAYFIDYYYNGAGTGSPDPAGIIPFDAPGTTILEEHTPVIWGGDLNQTIPGSGCWSKNPVYWLQQAQLTGGTDGTDRDRTDSRIDLAAEPLTGDQSTQSSSKIDYLLWQDSVTSSVREFIFNTSRIQQSGAPMPYPVNGFPFAAGASQAASDHRPVIVDFSLTLTPIS